MGKAHSVPLVADDELPTPRCCDDGDKQQSLLRLRAQIHFEYPFLRDVYESMLVTDAAVPDNPIVYVNDHFEKMTLYSREESLGRNCRFLQGPDTDPKTVQRIREAVVAGEQLANIAILNYRKDGLPFVNHFAILPVHQHLKRTGSVTHFIAIQRAIATYRPSAALPTSSSLSLFDVSDIGMDADDAIAVKFYSGADGTVRHLMLMSRRRLTLASLRRLWAGYTTIAHGAQELHNDDDLIEAIRTTRGGTLQLVLHGKRCELAALAAENLAVIDEASTSACPSSERARRRRRRQGAAAVSPNFAATLSKSSVPLDFSPLDPSSAELLSSLASTSASGSFEDVSDSAVDEWLGSLGLLHYQPLFREHQITSELLEMLSDRDLKCIGVDGAARRTMIKAIEQLQLEARE